MNEKADYITMLARLLEENKELKKKLEIIEQILHSYLPIVKEKK
tara:strand:+ start:2390 stop:2521 length:132 start_codon:yes stop_codon:yes gene_type:complete